MRKLTTQHVYALLWQNYVIAGKAFVNPNPFVVESVIGGRSIIPAPPYIKGRSTYLAVSWCLN